ncbi:carboxypeptidase-like regulatory domain-containing protein [Kordia sp.]|uniref:carboxypeptidase-like regulatory domain-containing protein n=1 Tax=Kordia sp. TaxID=1965332 RepID=UPI0025C06716|nr:carboxypeptidase-like regulatory domain-containing protein [Kordia sp.]MCH2195988.1 carboxypeptidase-like regulatory domain-containing protein [Kordia sp.]
MKKNYTLLFLYVSLLFTSISYTQTLEASVFDGKTQEPLFGVSVYFDGTTIGTTTNENGKFSIDYKASTQSPLVISYIGYETLLFDVRKLESGAKIYMKLKPQALGTVYLENDPWSRRKKMEIFKREFIGKTVEPYMCRIVNLDAIELVYNPTTQKLNAYADKPIIIRNKYLGYTVEYTLESFEADLRLTKRGDVLTRSVYVAGSTFYTERHKRVRRRHRKAREKEYGESVLYFMRSLAKKQLKENGFQIFRKGFIVPPYKYFKITPMGEDTKVKLTADRLVIVYDRFQKSFLTILEDDKEFVIDKYGNYTPPRRLSFGGVLGDKRIANTLPLNYNL